jgi:hypothetical protein
MICFEVFRNGKRLCTAGRDGHTMLGALVHLRNRKPWPAGEVAEGDPWPSDRPESLQLLLNGHQIPGPRTRRWESYSWLAEPLRVGDEIRVRVVETDQPDPPFTYEHHRRTRRVLSPEDKKLRRQLAKIKRQTAAYRQKAAAEEGGRPQG